MGVKHLLHTIADRLSQIDPEEKDHIAWLDKLVEEKTGIRHIEWVPCRERQPIRRGTYLTTTRRGAVRTNHWYGDEWGYGGDAVAWIELPPPYEEMEI